MLFVAISSFTGNLEYLALLHNSGVTWNSVSKESKSDKVDASIIERKKIEIRQV